MIARAVAVAALSDDPTSSVVRGPKPRPQLISSQAMSRASVLVGILALAALPGCWLALDFDALRHRDLAVADDLSAPVEDLATVDGALDVDLPPHADLAGCMPVALAPLRWSSETAGLPDVLGGKG